MTRPPRRRLFSRETIRAWRACSQRDIERILAVLVEFTSSGQWAEPLYVPPWKDKDAYGSVMGEYGPTCDGEYARKVAEYRASTNGGGLWDPDRDSPRKVIARKTRPVERPDAGRLVAWLEHNSGDVPDLEVCVGLELYLGGATLGEAAKRLGVKRSSVARANRLLLRRYTEWASGGGNMTGGKGND